MVRKPDERACQKCIKYRTHHDNEKISKKVYRDDILKSVVSL